MRARAPHVLARCVLPSFLLAPHHHQGARPMKLTSGSIAVLVSLSWLVDGCSSTALDHADSGQPAADGSDVFCEYNGTSHAPGTSFPSTDSCNTCSCTDS